MLMSVFSGPKSFNSSIINRPDNVVLVECSGKWKLQSFTNFFIFCNLPCLRPGGFFQSFQNEGKKSREGEGEEGEEGKGKKGRWRREGGRIPLLLFFLHLPFSFLPLSSLPLFLVLPLSFPLCFLNVNILNFFWLNCKSQCTEYVSGTFTITNLRRTFCGFPKL